MPEATPHDCAASRCDRDLVATPEHTKAELAEIRDTGSRLVDNLQRANVRHVVWLGLSHKDFEDLIQLAAAEERVKNYAVVIRRLVAREAKRLREERKAEARNAKSPAN